ncbi:MAG TPA: hypothetical protein VFX28_09295, partial [Methylomirabilota bacterium]|nr:hypothetical protein [Methylomirabilota bacterium]
LATLITSRGAPMSPTEIEDVIYQWEEVAEVVAYGVADAELGQAVHVIVTTRDERPPDVPGLTKHCVERMVDVMVPTHIHWMAGRMPRTASGKIDRTQVIARDTEYHC